MGFVYTEYNDSSVIVKNYKGEKKEVFVPSQINDKTVIEVSGLKNVEKLETIQIPATVEYIKISQVPSLKKVIISKEHKMYKARQILKLITLLIVKTDGNVLKKLQNKVCNAW